MSLLKPVFYYAAPTTGQTITLPSFDGDRLKVFIDPAGTLLALTVTLPTAIDGQTIAIGTTQAITTLTMTGGTIIAALTTLAIGGFGEWGYSATANKWLRIS